MQCDSLIECTLVLIKPDAVKRGLIGEIITRFEKAGLRLAAIKITNCSKQTLDSHFPINDLDWIRSMGEKAVENCNANGIDITVIVDTKDPLLIGRYILNLNYDYLLSGPIIAMIWQGQHSVSLVRKIVGSTIPANAAPGTIRGDFSSSSSDYSLANGMACQNVIHASSSKAESLRECSIWFTQHEINKTT